MLPLEQQVVSLELARRLHELEVKQESLFYWRDRNYIENKEEGYELIYSPGTFNECSVTIYDYYSAFTASELLKMLPSSINDWICRIESNNGLWEIKYCDHHGEKLFWICNHTNIINALAKMLIHLIEQGIVKP
jgi:hypothetical protein